jgi:fluoride ion exporter CrcB/FEX
LHDTSLLLTRRKLFLALIVGLCGGYTTFSSFSLDLFTLTERGAPGRAVV